MTQQTTDEIDGFLKDNAYFILNGNYTTPFALFHRILYPIIFL